MTPRTFVGKAARADLSAAMGRKHRNREDSYDAKNQNPYRI